MIRTLLLGVAIIASGCAYEALPTAPTIITPPPVLPGPVPPAQQPVPDLFVTLKSGPADPVEGQQTALIAQANSPASSYAWTFGDGQTAQTTIAQTTHSYRRAGDYQIAVRVIDDTGRTATAENLIRVREKEAPPPAPPNCPTTTISPASLPNGQVGSSYSRALSATGGQGPYGFAVASGDLPAGLLLSNAGLISGTPTTPGTSTFIVRAVDDKSCAGLRSYSITIADKPGAMTATMSCTPHATLSQASCNMSGSYGGSPVPSGQVSRVDWDWGDGNTSTSSSPAQTHLYVQPGTYTVIGEMTATTSGGVKTATASRTVTVP